MINLIAQQLISNAYAQAAAAGAPQNPMLQFLPLIIVFVIFYFLMIRPQKKKFDEEQAMISKLGKGDEVYTKSGIIGTISGINDKIVDLEVSPGIKIKVMKSQIGGMAKSVLETEKK